VPATLLEDNRSLHQYGERWGTPCQVNSNCGPYDDTYTPAVPFDPWRNTTATSLQMQANLFALGSYDPTAGYEYQTFTFEIVFGLDDYTEATLEGFLSVYYGEASVQLENISGAVFEQALDGSNYADYLWQGILGPGQYTIRGIAAGFGSSDIASEGNLGLTLTLEPGVAVPEPASGALLGLGLAAIALRARQARTVRPA
jgi:hypothetical protein